MLKLIINEIRFGKKIIFKKTRFEVIKGTLTGISGDSGSGKSTLIQQLVRPDFGIESYYLDDIDVLSLPKEEQNDYLKNHLSVAYQLPVLLEDLTLWEQVTLIKELFSSKVDEKPWCQELGLIELLDKYPTQLSGGEQIRFSLLLAILKDTEYLILDEPTASLDEYHTKKVMDVLKNYVALGKTVILSTHDSSLLEKCDVIYRIQDQHLIKMHDSVAIEESIQPSRIIPLYSARCLLVSFYQMRKHKKWYKKIMLMITSFVIGFAAFFSQYDNAFRSYYVEQMNDMSAMDIVIYKPQGGRAKNDGVPNAEGNDPPTVEELKNIQSIDHVVEIRPRVDLSIGLPFNYDIEEINIYRPMDPYLVEIFDGDQLIIEKEFNQLDGDIPIQNTYYEDQNYDSYIYEKYNDQGVFISMDYAKKLTDGNIDVLKGKWIQCQILIPIYDSIGKSWAVAEDDVRYYPTMTTCKAVLVKIPIAGVLKQSSMGINNMYNHAIYIEYDDIEKLIKTYQKEEERVCYIFSTDPYEYSVNENDTGKTPLYTIQESAPWTPRSYTVIIDNAENIDAVVDQMNEYGFNVSSQYFSASATLSSMDDFKQTIQWAAFAIVLVVIFINLMIKINNNRDERTINHYFASFGFSKRAILKMKCLKYASQTFFSIVYSFIFMMAILVIANEWLHYGYTSINLIMFTVLFALDAFIEFVIPILLERRNQND